MTFVVLRSWRRFELETEIVMRKKLPSILVAFGLLATPAAAGDRVALPWLDVGLALPAGWTMEISDEEPLQSPLVDGTFRLQAELICGTDLCRTTQETCTIRTYGQVLETSDVVSNLMLFPTQASIDEATELALELTSEDAAVAKPLTRELLGRTPWFTIETRAAPGYKSALHARTVIKGRFMWALCKTCPGDAERFADARRILACVHVVPR